MVLLWGLLRLGAALALPLTVLASDSNSNPIAVPRAYIVEFDDVYTSGDGFLSELAASGIHATRRRELSSPLFSGLSFTLDSNENEAAAVDRISSMPGIKWITPVRTYEAPQHQVLTAGDSTTATILSSLRARDADTEVVHQMTGVDKLRAEGYTGKGIKIAVVDSGVDYKHPALGGCFGPGCLVAFGSDLVGDNVSTGLKPDADPYSNCNGHGTHVSGVIAAQPNPYGFTGVAPNATLGMYRVLDCRGRSSGTDVIMDAFMRAYSDGADIITASLGGYSGWSEEPWGVLIQKITEAGVPCLVAVGNDGYYGPFHASDGADGKGATGVGSVNNLVTPMFLIKGTYTSRNATASDFGWSAAGGSDFENGTYPLYPLSLNSTTPSDGCSPLLPSTPDLSDKIVLIRRGGCAFNVKAQNAAAAGATRVLFYNNGPGTDDFQLTGNLASISAGMVPKSTGEEWIRLVAAGSPVQLHMASKESASRTYKVEKNTFSGGFVSDFSQWGPTNELNVLPTVMAPGGFIMSTYPVALGGYAVESGTSMATPYVAGCIALLLEARGKVSPATINALLSMNGDPNVFYDGTSVHPYLAPVVQQGGGLINIYEAVHDTTFVNTSSISFNDTDHLSPRAFTIHNRGNETVSYTLDQVGAGTVYTLPADGNQIPSPFDGSDLLETVANYARLDFDSPVLVLSQNQTATVRVSVSLPQGLNETRIPIYSGYITLNGTNGNSLSIPYMGVASAMKDAVILDTQGGDNYLAASTSSTPIQAGYTFQLPAPNGTTDGNVTLPTFNLRLAMGSRLVRVDVKPANGTTGMNTTDIAGQRVLGSIPGFPKYFQPRNPVQPASVQWNGELSDGRYAPAGSYTLLVRALKIFGDPANPKDYDTVETPLFGVQYAGSLNKRSLRYINHRSR